MHYPIAIDREPGPCCRNVSSTCLDALWSGQCTNLIVCANCLNMPLLFRVSISSCLHLFYGAQQKNRTGQQLGQEGFRASLAYDGWIDDLLLLGAVGAQDR